MSGPQIVTAPSAACPVHPPLTCKKPEPAMKLPAPFIPPPLQNDPKAPAWRHEEKEAILHQRLLRLKSWAKGDMLRAMKRGMGLSLQLVDHVTGTVTNIVHGNTEIPKDQEYHSVFIQRSDLELKDPSVNDLRERNLQLREHSLSTDYLARFNPKNERYHGTKPKFICEAPFTPFTRKKRKDSKESTTSVKKPRTNRTPPREPPQEPPQELPQEPPKEIPKQHALPYTAKYHPTVSSFRPGGDALL